ncbi:SWI/SNF-related matrix-associated actin-dependent regulator of chromatin subfamily A containing DEAD/H box 1A-like isoform X1 [Myxocyprinus asiaticus]|uniref:SWI/SNF-related matrix-associated actin-dependent regulator of chromatin subfamily A containing DEAD/H box 1A-like isoform X1 n=2 Tax=Myxocyprinus asiaticus TaxID=70543 RepID=UPI002221FE65|nr:SWI/SNF-related matrix-associated actin-dependent regulator of chromatin subfamily A containing DEAD/H box 1A-like isoform X1 [Myxocyprinus asiaticus]
MSFFNLERFRFQNDRGIDSRSKSVDGSSSDKENHMAHQRKMDGRCATVKTSRQALEDVFADDKVVRMDKDSPSKTAETKHQINKELEDRVTKLMEMFPQKSKSDLLEVVESTSTLEGAVAQCLIVYGDKDSGRRKCKAGHSEDDVDTRPIKRRKIVRSDLEEEDSEDKESQDPSRERQEALLRKLMKKLPDLEKEVLRDVLREHDWDYENALGSLLVFSTTDASSPEEQRKQKPKSSHSKEKTGKRLQKPESLSRWLTAAPSPVRKSSILSAPEMQKSTSSKNSTKNSSFKRERDDENPLNDVSGSEDEEELDSEVESVSDDLESEDEYSISGHLQDQVFLFFQEASLDELALISGCSNKKAQKIISLRPFNTWKDVKEQFYKENGLSMGLVHGCKVVLKERQVVRDLMGRCEKIAQKMTKDVTQVIELGMGSMKQPKVLNSNFKLQPYQLIGLKWLILLHQHKLSGILADEMGLGKTIQAIAFLAHLYEKGIMGPHLITVPSSTLDNWVRELGLWCPSLKVLVYYGSVEDRKYLRQEILSNLIDFNIIVSTYNLTIGNVHDRSLFRKLRLKYAIFDEGHMLKNMNTLRYRHLMAINAEHRLLLTGTPLQNNLLELMSLLNFIMPSMFSSSTSQISKMFSTRSSEEESSFHKERIAQAKLIMKPFILRRVKIEVLKQLPPKVEKIEMCPMSDAQQKLYDNLFKRLKKTTNGDKRELCNVMMQLRKMANHPLLHRQYYTSDKLAAMSKAMLKEPTHFDSDPVLIQEDMEVMSDFELHNLCKEYSSISSFQLEKELILDSGKFALLTKLLAKLKEKGDRVVLFSQFTMMLDIVEILLEHLGHQFVRLDGSTPMAERIGLIDQFNTNSEIFVFLLSTRAGGLGINLASANTVILHDIDCNPFNDKQAEDRCHRMGQIRTVQVLKLICKDSIEACMLRVGQEKLKLEQDMTTDGGEDGAMTEQMAELLKVSLGL